MATMVTVVGPRQERNFDVNKYTGQFLNPVTRSTDTGGTTLDLLTFVERKANAGGFASILRPGSKFVLRPQDAVDMQARIDTAPALHEQDEDLQKELKSYRQDIFYHNKDMAKRGEDAAKLTATLMDCCSTNVRLILQGIINNHSGNPEAAWKAVVTYITTTWYGQLFERKEQAEKDVASIGYATNTEQLAMVLLQLEVAYDRMDKLLLQPDGFTPIDHAYPPMDDAAKIRKVQERLGHESLLEYSTRIKAAISGAWTFGVPNESRSNLPVKVPRQGSSPARPGYSQPPPPRHSGGGESLLPTGRRAWGGAGRWP